MASELRVSLEDVTFTYEDGSVALRDLSLRVHAGEFAVVLGANGAGKSTLCYLISGIVPHIYGGRRRGEVLVGGKDPWDDPLYVTAQTCGMLMQDPEVQLFMPTVRAELAFGPSNLGVSRSEILSRVEAALALVQLSGFEDRNPRELSGGQKQRVALASILTMNPQILVLDEPTSQLDPLGRREVVAAIAELKRRGDLAILMTTHETEEILPLADQVVVLENGLPVVQGAPRRVFSQPKRLEAAGVKVPALLEVQARVAEVKGLQSDLRVGATVGEVAEEIRQAVSRGELILQDPVSLPSADATGNAPILEVEDLTVTYPASPPVVALSRMNLTIRGGEFAAIIGQNGSGKSTLVKCLVGLLRPAAGQVRFRGQDIRRLSVGEMARRVGLVLQNPDYQLFTSSCREEVRFGLKNLHLPAGEIEERCDQALAAVGLLEQADVFPFRLSFGDRRKLAVAATLALRPEVLILDEPTTAQDYRGRYQLAELARRFHDEQGGTVVIISHDVDLVARYARRVIILQAGHVLLDGPSAQVFAQEETLKESFVVSPVVMQLARELGLPSGWTSPEQLVQMLQPAGREEGVR